MPKTTAGLVAAIMLATTSSGAMAQSLTWRISETAGAVSVRRGAVSTPATRGALLAPGDAVTTGAGGRAVLVHDRDFVTVSANSRVSVPVAEEATGFVKIVQDLGNAIFKIQKLGVPHFGVKTPYLAAVVKGTTFSVTVDRAGTSLQVVEGAVEVATLDGGARDLIRPGSVASIGAGDLFRLQVHGDGDRTIDSPARAAAATGAAAPVATSAVASAEPVVADATVEALPAAPQEIGEAISSKPVDLAAMTGGMMTGSSAGVSATLLASVKADLVRPGAVEPVATPPVAEPAAAPVAEAPPAAAPPAEVASVTPPPTAEAPAPVPAPVADVVAPPVEVATAAPPPPAPGPTADVPKAGDLATVQPGGDAGKAADDAKKVADDAAKAADKAAKDAAKAADDISKGKADDAAKAAEKAAKDAEDAAKNAAKDAKDAAAQQSANEAYLADLIKKLTKLGKQMSGKDD